MNTILIISTSLNGYSTFYTPWKAYACHGCNYSYLSANPPSGRNQYLLSSSNSVLEKSLLNISPQLEENGTAPRTIYKPDIELAASIIARHEKIHENQLKYTKQAQDRKLRQARAQGIEIPWESHWKELDE
jgi:hypothetical protein